MDDLTCRFAIRYHDLRSSLWSILGLPPSSTDGEIIAAVRERAVASLEAPSGRCLAQPFILAVIDEDAP